MWVNMFRLGTERPIVCAAHTPACRLQPCAPSARLAASARMDLKAWRSKSCARLDLLRASASQLRQQRSDRSIRCDAAQPERSIVCIGEGLFGAAASTPIPSSDCSITRAVRVHASPLIIAGVSLRCRLPSGSEGRAVGQGGDMVRCSPSFCGLKPRWRHMCGVRGTLTRPSQAAAP